MKVGFVVECSPSGQDAIIYPYVAQSLCPSIKIEKPITLTSLKGVMNEGAIHAQTLLETGCDYVFVIWDRMPKWDGTGIIEDYKQQVEADLKKHSINMERVFLCCIDHMLESWIIADARGINQFFQDKNLRHKPKKAFPDCKTHSSQAEAKNKIKSYARNNRVRYDEFLNPFEIVKRMPGFTEPAQRNDSFRYFKESVEQICPS